MMADLVHEDVGDEVAEGFLVLGPVVEDRPAVEPDHVGELSRYERGPALSQPDAAEKSQARRQERKRMAVVLAEAEIARFTGDRP